jgi:hypothetical protein
MDGSGASQSCFFWNEFNRDLGLETFAGCGPAFVFRYACLENRSRRKTALLLFHLRRGIGFLPSSAWPGGGRLHPFEKLKQMPAVSTAEWAVSVKRIIFSPDFALLAAVRHAFIKDIDFFRAAARIARDKPRPRRVNQACVSR